MKDSVMHAIGCVSMHVSSDMHRKSGFPMPVQARMHPSRPARLQKIVRTDARLAPALIPCGGEFIRQAGRRSAPLSPSLPRTSLTPTPPCAPARSLRARALIGTGGGASKRASSPQGERGQFVPEDQA
ncbi:hypothetical protein FQZ97_1074720 [compost metagenome]